MSPSLVLVTAIVGPRSLISIVMNEVGLLVHDLHVVEVIILIIQGDKDMLPPALRTVGTADAIRNGFGEEGKEVEADALLAQVVSRDIGISQRLVDRINAGIGNVGNLRHVVGREDMDTSLCRITIALMSVLEDAVVPFWERIEIDAIALCTLVNLYQTVAAINRIPLHDRDRVALV